MKFFESACQGTLRARFPCNICFIDYIINYKHKNMSNSQFLLIVNYIRLFCTKFAYIINRITLNTNCMAPELARCALNPITCRCTSIVRNTTNHEQAFFVIRIFLLLFKRIFLLPASTYTLLDMCFLLGHTRFVRSRIIKDIRETLDWSLRFRLSMTPNQCVCTSLFYRNNWEISLRAY